MPVKRRAPKFRRPDLSEVVNAILHDLPLPAETAANSVELYLHRDFRRSGDLTVPTVEDAWLQYCDDIVADWIEDRPATRPRCWWHFSAPRWTEAPDLGEPRHQLGGAAVAELGFCREWHDLDLGIPRRWSTEPSPTTPALFESQAAYLERHGLFLPGERRRIAASAMQPDILTSAPV